MGWKLRLVQALRWGLLLIVLFVGYLGAGFLSAREFTWWIVPALMLVTTTAVFVAKKAGPSPRASIVLAGVGIILVALIALAGAETPGSYMLCATAGCLLGLAIGTIISTTKGPERSKVVRALRWALFLPVAVFASVLWDFAAELLLSPVGPGWLNWAIVALVLGVSGTIFISTAALVAPSHRTVVILLLATLGYASIFWNYEFYDFPYSLLGEPALSPRDAYLYLGLLTWGIGLAVGGFAALRIPAYLDASWRRTAERVRWRRSRRR
jgi:hypothetical protein